MRILLALLVFQTDDKKDLKVSAEKMAKVKSYQFRVALESGSEMSTHEGEFADGTVHVKSEKGEAARHGDVRLFKPKGGDWKEMARGGKREAEPHEWIERIVALVPALKKERSDKVQGVTVDVYVYALEAAAAKKAFEVGGIGPLFVDWTKTKNGILIYVGRADDLIYRVELRADAGKMSTGVTVDFSRFNQTKLSLPKEILDRLK